MNATPPQIKVSQLTLYNPARLKDAEIDAAFVVRKAVFDRMLGEIAAEKPSSRAQHHLIVGQRGMGKSTLLASHLAAELRTNAGTRETFRAAGLRGGAVRRRPPVEILVELPGFARRCRGPGGDTSSAISIDTSSKFETHRAGGTERG